ncbi:hypothetical protein AVEN_11357-1 [Araneus ventricosus]|uniref:Uncharacterized protein n=1 Tax=Araneus ventricosus TaxID=182803 RepID=A0A4Y2HC99_ARAVE|nr:hypothetical protein AVEN_11357-1 [Araneus ventricosus]
MLSNVNCELFVFVEKPTGYGTLLTVRKSFARALRTQTFEQAACEQLSFQMYTCLNLQNIQLPVKTNVHDSNIPESEKHILGIARNLKSVVYPRNAEFYTILDEIRPREVCVIVHVHVNT